MIETQPQYRYNGFRKRQVLAYIRAEIAATGNPPSYGMIERECHMSGRNKVGVVIKRLEAEGKLARIGSGRVRRIRVLN